MGSYVHMDLQALSREACQVCMRRQAAVYACTVAHEELVVLQDGIQLVKVLTTHSISDATVQHVFPPLNAGNIFAAACSSLHFFGSVGCRCQAGRRACIPSRGQETTPGIGQ